jgi:hypothetical protein
VSPRSKPTKKDRPETSRAEAAERRAQRAVERQARVRPVAVMFAVILAVVAGVLVVLVSSSTKHASASQSMSQSASEPTSPPTIATAPFAAPTSVTLADTPPPWTLPADARPYIAAAGLSVLGSEQLAVHYHAHLDIVANGAKVTVPAGIGFVISHGQATGITVLHTHDTTGVLHIESATQRPYTLGQLFTEWGVALNATQLGGLHADATHVLAAYVNGHRFTGDPATFQLKRHLEIALWYGPSSQSPHVPRSYHFSAGL